MLKMHKSSAADNIKKSAKNKEISEINPSMSSNEKPTKNMQKAFRATVVIDNVRINIIRK